MKLRVRMDPDDFLAILGIGTGKVIKTGKVLFSGLMYVTEADGYYYYTFSKEPLSLPKDVSVVNAMSVTFP